jgi:hypothetical protein
MADATEFRRHWESAYHDIERLAAPVAGDPGNIDQAVAHIGAAAAAMRSVDPAEIDDLRERDGAMVLDFFESLPSDLQGRLMRAGFEVIFGDTRLT